MIGLLARREGRADAEVRPGHAPVGECAEDHS